MATRKDIKDSKYLDKMDCEPAVKVTIDRCVEEDVSMENKPTKLKHVLYFKELQKGMVLNLTNWDRIESITKESDSDNWNGAVITLYNDPTVEFGGELVGGIRVWVQQVIPAGIEQAQQQPPQRAGLSPNPDYVGDNPPPPTDDDPPF